MEDIPMLWLSSFMQTQGYSYNFTHKWHVEETFRQSESSNFEVNPELASYIVLHYRSLDLFVGADKNHIVLTLIKAKVADHILIVPTLLTVIFDANNCIILRPFNMDVDDVGPQDNAVVNEQTKGRIREFNDVADFVHYISVEFGWLFDEAFSMFVA